jgi:hypothetical protein
VISVTTLGTLAGTLGSIGRSHAEIQFVGIRNSDQPQSRQTWTSGFRENGGWLSVRGALRYRRISAGMTDKSSDLQLGQTIAYTPKVELPCGKHNSKPSSTDRATKITHGHVTIGRFALVDPTTFVPELHLNWILAASDWQQIGS